MQFADLLVHLEWLLSTQSWDAAALHVRYAAQTAPTRAGAQALRLMVRQVPDEVCASGEWPHALAWVAYRTADQALLHAALHTASSPWPAFYAFAASLTLNWTATLDWAEQGMQLAEPDRMIALRYYACALAELEHPDWEQAFETAIRQSRGRDRGLTRLDFEYYLIRHGQEAAARDVLAAATADFHLDEWAMTLNLANLGISCLRLDDLVEAERALHGALHLGAKGAGQTHLSTVWRGLGSVYYARHQPARAEHAYVMAEEKADNSHDRVSAMRSRSRVLRETGRLNEALTLLHDARQHAQLEEGQPHALYADLAGVRFLVGDVSGAQAALMLVPSGDQEDTWRVAVVQAACLLLQAPAQAAAHLQAAQVLPYWARREARAFPAVFLTLGIKPDWRAWTCDVYTSGPVRAVMNGMPLSLRSTRPEAVLLALLISRGNCVAVETVLTEVELKGRDERARGKTLSRVVRALNQVLGWPGAVKYDHRVLVLSTDVQWTVHLPAPAHADSFCDGRYDPWVTEWRYEYAILTSPN